MKSAKLLKLKEEALIWLDKNEPKWELDKPINRDKFIEDLISRIAKEKAMT